MTVPSTDSRPDAPSGDRGATVPAADPRQVLRLAMRVAIAMLGSGAQTDDVETAIDTTGRAYRIDPIQRSVTFSGIAISYDDPTDGHPPTTLLYTVPERVSDFARLAAASSVVRRIKAGDLDIAGAEGALDELVRQPPPYGRAISFAAPAVSAAGSTVVFGGAPLDAIATLAVALVIQPALSSLDRSELPPFFRTFFGVAASTLLVALLVALGLPIVGGLVLTGSLLRFLPGYALVSGFRDLIDQSIISGSARLAEALLLGAGAAAGTALALVAAASFGVHLSLITTGNLANSSGGIPTLAQSGINTAAEILTDTIINNPARKATDKLFGLNVFEIDPIISGSQLNPTARLTVGRQINNNLRVTYSTNLSQDQQQVLALEYRVSNKLSFVAQYEQRSLTNVTRNRDNFSFEIRFRKRF